MRKLALATLWVALAAPASAQTPSDLDEFGDATTVDDPIGATTPFEARCAEVDTMDEAFLEAVATCHGRTIDRAEVMAARSRFRSAVVSYATAVKAPRLPRGCLGAAPLEEPALADGLSEEAKAAERERLTEETARNALRALDALLDRAEEGASPRDFEQVWTKDRKRLDACLEVRAKRLAALGGAAKRTLEREQEAAPELAFAADTLRKSSTSPTLATASSQLVENPGSPEHVTYSLLSALGADKESNGTQIQLTLNLSSLVTSKEQRETLPAYARNVFVRGTFPLSSTKSRSEGESMTASSESVRRFAVTLGGSLLDDSDPRLAMYEPCYQAALGYAPFPRVGAAAVRRREVRTPLFDVCNRIAANAHRLAWRAGVGFVSATSDESTTKPEIYAGTLVYAPSSYVYINALYQHVARPETRRTYGLAVSTAANVGGGYSGARAWGRLGLDLTFLATELVDRDRTTWEFRVSPTVRAKFFNDAATTFGIGPRVLSGGDTQLLATVAFGYDSDRIINQLLTPPPAP